MGLTENIFTSEKKSFTINLHGPGSLRRIIPALLMKEYNEYAIKPIAAGNMHRP
jgi:hypothetical protein